MSISSADTQGSQQLSHNAHGSFETRSVDTDDPVQRAIEGLTELAEKSVSTGGTNQTPGAGRIEGAIALYGLMEEGEMQTPEELRERMKESGNELLEGLAEDSEWIAELDAAGHGGKQNGVVSRDAVGDYLQSVHQRVENILDGELTDGDYEDLKSLAAQDAAAGQEILGELSKSQREDLSHSLADDPELLRDRALLELKPAAYDQEAAEERARELIPETDSALRREVTGILNGSLTGSDYTALKEIFARDSALGEKLLEEIAPLQPALAERLGKDLEMRREGESWSAGFKSLLGASLGASRKLLQINPERAQQVSARLENQRQEAEGVWETIGHITGSPVEYEAQWGLPPGTVQPFVEEAEMHDDQLDGLLNQLFHANMALNQAAETNAANLDEYFHSALEASAALSGYMEEHVQPFMQRLNDAEFAALNEAEFVALNQPGTPEQTEGPRPTPPGESECSDSSGAGPGSCSAQDEAGPSDLTLIHVPLVLPNGETQDFYVHDQAELESELTGNAAFIAYANEYLPGWDMVGFAAFCARLLLMGKQLPK
jgi:hypothetical protein